MKFLRLLYKHDFNHLILIKYKKSLFKIRLKFEI